MKRLIALVCSILLLVGCACAQELPLPAEQPAPAAATLSAVGSAQPEVSGTRALITLSLSAEGKTVLEAQQQMDGMLTLLMDTLSAQGIEEKDVRDTRYDVTGMYEYNHTRLTENELLTGYRVLVEKQAYVQDPRDAVTLIDAVHAAGVSCEYDLGYETVSAPGALDAALAQAAQQAMLKAGILAEASGLKLDRLVSVEEMPETGMAVVRVTYTVK